MSKTQDKLDNLSRQGLDSYLKVRSIERRIAELTKQIAGLSTHLTILTDIALDEQSERRHHEVTEDVLAHAIKTKQVVAFRYEDTNGVELLRIVSPWETKQTATGPHLVGYDHPRGGTRQFALRRITELEIQPSYTFVTAGAVYDPLEEAQVNAPFSGSLVRGDQLVR